LIELPHAPRSTAAATKAAAARTGVPLRRTRGSSFCGLAVSMLATLRLDQFLGRTVPCERIRVAYDRSEPVRPVGLTSSACATTRPTV